MTMPKEAKSENWIRVSVGNQEGINAVLEAMKGYDPGRVYHPFLPVFHHGI